MPWPVQINWESMVWLSKRYFLPALALVVFWSQAALAQPGTPPLFEVSASKYMLGTRIELKALYPDILACKKAFYDAFQETNRIEDLLSYRREHSEISAINRAAGVTPVRVSYETFALIQRASNYSAQTEGLFDISIGPVTTLWGFNDDVEITIPPSQLLAERLKLVDYRRIILNPADTTVFLKTKGMRLDLGGIGKGYAVDRIVAVLKAKGLIHFFVDAGGDIYAAGYKLDNQEWTVGIQHPRQPNELLATFEGHDLAVATSGDYERYKIIDGQRYHHIIDPRTGFPASMSQSVTVFANSVEEAVVWGKYVFIIGAQNYAQQTSLPAIKACIVEASGAVQCDSSLVTDYHLHSLTNTAFSQLQRN